MEPLVRLLLVNLVASLVLGSLVAVALLLSGGVLGLFIDEPLAALLLLWAFGASFAIGMIGTRVGMAG